MEVADLRTILKGHGVESPSKMVKSELVRAILNKEHKIVRASRGGRKSIPLKLDAATLSMYGEDRLRKIAVQRSKGKPVPATLKKDQLIAVILATRSPKGGTVEVHKMVAQMLGPTATKTKKGKSLVRHGLGPFRIVFSKDSKVVGDLGPYASARAASTDAKTLLRTAAPIDKYAISQRGGQQAIEAGQTGDIQGEVVDGYIVTPKGNAVEMDLDAFVYQPKARNVAYAHDKLTKFMPGGSEVAPMKLRANPKFRANRAAIKAKLASMNPKKRKSKAAKRNGKVAFRTRDGRTISFNAR
jgi:hypothetical protein